MKTINETTWYKQTEYADMYGRSRQAVNQLIKEGRLKTRTVNGRTLVSGLPPVSWQKSAQEIGEIKIGRLYDMPPFCFQCSYQDAEQEEPHPEKEPFPDAWEIAKKFDRSWKEVEFVGKELKNDPANVELFFQILNDWSEGEFEAWEEAGKPKRAPGIGIEHFFRKRLTETLNRMPTRK